MGFSWFSNSIRGCFSPQTEYHWISGPHQVFFCNWPISGWTKHWLWSHRKIKKIILKPPKPRSEAEESRGTGSAGLRQLRPDYTSCWWGTLQFSAQGLSLSCYNSFHKRQLINTLLSVTEENEPRECHWSFFVHKAHKGIDWVPLQQETISLTEPGRGGGKCWVCKWALQYSSVFL